MVLQIPLLDSSSETMEYEDAPLDLSASNSSSLPSPPRTPDYTERLELGTAGSPHDSDDSDCQRTMAQNPAKSYKKAIMKRYLNTESSPIISHVNSSYNKSSSNSRQQHQRQHQQNTQSFYTPEEEEHSGSLRLVDIAELQQPERPLRQQEYMAPHHHLPEHHNNNNPSLNPRHHPNGAYIVHPAAHEGHRTAYSRSPPNTSANTEDIKIFSHLHDSHYDSSHRQIRHHPRSQNQNSFYRQSSGHNQNHRFLPHQVQRDQPLFVQELTSRGQLKSQVHSNNSSVYNPTANTKIVYTIHPADHEGNRTSYTISHPNIFVGGPHSPSRVDSEVLHVGDSSLRNNKGFQKKYSNSIDNNWEVQTVDYADLDLHFPSPDSSSTPEGFSLNYIDSPPLEFDGNLVNMQNANPYNLPPQDQRFNNPVESPQNINATESRLKVKNIDAINAGEGGEKRVIRAKPKPEIVISLSKSCLEVVLRKVPGVGGRARWPKSWEFVMRLIMHEETNPYLVRWEDKSQYIFRLVQSDTITYIWNTKSEKACDSYYNFARGLRYHYKKQILIPIREKQLVYQCGPKAIDYINKLQQS